MTDAAYTKRHLSLEEQLTLLKSRGLEVEDDAEGARWLGIIGYYRLSGYTYAYRRIVDGVRTDRFLDSTTLDQVLALYDFDRRLKLLTMDALERIEIAVRSQVGYVLGLRGTYAHLDPSNLDGKFTTPPSPASTDGEPEPSRYSEWLDKISEAQRKSREDFVEHFRTKYDGRLPVWVATEVLDFGGLSNLYAGLQHSDRSTVARHFGVVDAFGAGNGKALANWMQVLNHVRNLCAHHSRLWNRNLPIWLAPKHVRSIPALRALTAPDAAIGRPFTPFLVMTYLLGQFEPENAWSTRLVDLVTTALPPTGRHPAEMGLPAGWERLFL